MPSPPAAGSRPEAPSHPGPLPPWLWVWAMGLLAAMPQILAESWGSARAFYAVSWIPSDLWVPIAVIHAFIAGFELLPILVLLAGVLLAALPGWRARRLVRRYRLEPAAAAGGALSEIAAFVHGHAPELEVRADLGRMNPLAFVFPLGLRRSAIAVFGGLVRLWRRDRAAAEAVLLHEIAHHRQGDPLIIGTGSFLTPALRLWPLAVLAFALSVGLLDLAFARQLERFAAAYGQVAPPELGPPPEGSWDVVFFFLHDFVWFLHPSLIGTVGQLALWFLAVAVLPILAVWCAELTADRFTVAEEAHREALLRALSAPAAPAGRPGGLGGLRRRLRMPAFLLRGLTHPPGRLRRLLASRGGGAAGLLATVIIFPAGYLASAVIVVTMGWIAASSRGTMPGVGLLAYLAGGVPFILAGIWVQLAIVAGLLLAWPWLRPWWLALIARRRPPVELRDAPALGLAGAAMLALIAAVDPFGAGAADGSGGLSGQGRGRSSAAAAPRGRPSAPSGRSSAPASRSS